MSFTETGRSQERFPELRLGRNIRTRTAGQIPKTKRVQPNLGRTRSSLSGKTKRQTTRAIPLGPIARHLADWNLTTAFPLVMSVEIEMKNRQDEVRELYWDQNHPSTDVYVTAALSLARALVFRHITAEKKINADFNPMDR